VKVVDEPFGSVVVAVIVKVVTARVGVVLCTDDKLETFFTV